MGYYKDGRYIGRRKGVSAKAFGADPSAPVHRGGAPEWPGRRPSKIRDRRTGLLLEPPHDPHRVTTEEGERMRSTRYFRTQAREVMARTDLAPRDRNRMLAMIRKACAIFLEARRAGINLDGSSPAAAARYRAKKRQQYLARKS